MSVARPQLGRAIDAARVALHTYEKSLGQSKHVYTLRFDTEPDQTVEAYGPTQAIMLRTGERLPYQVTDETLLNRWLTRAPKVVAAPVIDDATPRLFRYSERAGAPERVIDRAAASVVITERARERRTFVAFAERWDSDG